MTPNELYAREPIKRHSDLNWLVGCYFNHVPESDSVYNGTLSVTDDHVELRVYKDHWFDGRRFWRLASVWFDGKPVMVIQNAGREGDDYVGRFITDVDVYKDLVKYVKSLIPPNEVEVSKKDVVDPTLNVKCLTCFYGNELDDPFDHH